MSILINVQEGGDLDGFLSVDGVHDWGENAYGVYTPANFVADPFATGTGWKTGNPPERRLLNCRHVEEWLRVWEQSYYRNGLDTLTGLEAFEAWEFAEGGSMSTLAVNGTQLNGRTFCKRSWWEHVLANRNCVYKGSSTNNFFGSPGTTPRQLADTFLDNSLWTVSSVNQTAPPSRGIGAGKPFWQLGWKPLVFNVTPITAYGWSHRHYQVGWERTAFPDGSPGYADWDWEDWFDPSRPYNLNQSKNGDGSHEVGAKVVYEVDAFTTYADGVLLDYHLWVGPPYAVGSAGTSPPRPRQCLRNVMGWVEEMVARCRTSGYDDTGLGADIVFGFFWGNNTTDSNGASFAGTTMPNPEKLQGSVILGGFGSSEGDVDLDDALDALWTNSSSFGAFGVGAGRVPVFYLGPRWGQTLPTYSGVDSVDIHTYVTNTHATDDAATAGVNHLLSLSSASPSNWGLRIGSERYPFGLGNSLLV